MAPPGPAARRPFRALRSPAWPDLGGLPVRVQRGSLVPSDTRGTAAELRAVKDYQLVRIDVGAPLSLFELPDGATLIPNPDDQ